MTKSIVIAAALVLLALPLLAQQQGSCMAVAVSSAQQAGGAYATSFSATSILDLDLTMLFTPGSVNRFGAGDHVAEFRIYTPKGNLYQSISVPFTSDNGKEGRQQKVDGYPRPIAVKLVKKTTFKGQSSFGVSATLPVAGTSIVASSLYGSWKTEAYVDGEAAPCSSTAVFEIRQ